MYGPPSGGGGDGRLVDTAFFFGIVLSEGEIRCGKMKVQFVAKEENQDRA
jgi:hypothetical protein